MKRNLFSAAIISCAVIATSCSNTPKGNDTGNHGANDLAATRKAIDSLNQQFSQLFVKGDSVGVANLYTQDAKFMDAGAPSVSGRPAIQMTMGGFMRSGITKVDFQTTAVYGCDSLVAEEGQLKLFVKAQQVADDKYIVLWKKEAGQWKIFRDISNSNQPPTK